MGFEQIIFILLALGAIVTSALVVLPPSGKNPLYGALMLIVSFFFIAGLYVLLFAHTMAIFQILVYAGAIMVLFIFVIMLLNLSDEELTGEKRTWAKVIGVLGTVAILAKGLILLQGQAPAMEAKALPEAFGNIEPLADVLYQDYLIPFELTGLLLLVAIAGAIILAKRTL